MQVFHFMHKGKGVQNIWMFLPLVEEEAVHLIGE